MFGLIVILALTGMALWFGVPWLISLFGPIALVLITIGLTLEMLLLVYFYLAPNNYFFTFVNEATSKIIVKAGNSKKRLFNGKDTPWTKTGILFLKILGLKTEK